MTTDPDTLTTRVRPYAPTAGRRPSPHPRGTTPPAPAPDELHDRVRTSRLTPAPGDPTDPMQSAGARLHLERENDDARHRIRALVHTNRRLRQQRDACLHQLNAYGVPHPPVVAPHSGPQPTVPPPSAGGRHTGDHPAPTRAQLDAARAGHLEPHPAGDPTGPPSGSIYAQLVDEHQGVDPLAPPPQ